MKITRIESLQNIAYEVRKDILEEVYEAQSGHPGGALSCADILTVLYFNQMNVDPKRPEEIGLFFLKDTARQHCTVYLQKKDTLKKNI